MFYLLESMSRITCSSSIDLAVTVITTNDSNRTETVVLMVNRDEKLKMYISISKTKNLHKHTFTIMHNVMLLPHSELLFLKFAQIAWTIGNVIPQDVIPIITFTYDIWSIYNCN